MRLPIKKTVSLQSFVSALLIMLFITSGFAGTAQSTLDGGSINNPSQTIYPGSTPAQITATAASGVGAPGCDEFYQYQWQISTDNVNFTNISGATQINYQPGPVSQTTYFRRRVTHCGTTVTTSNTATITIDNTLPQAGCINADTVFVKINTVLPSPVDATTANFPCSGSYTYQWQVSTDNQYFTDVPGATGEDLNYTQPVTTTLFFIRKAKCGNTTKYTNSVTVYPVYTACADFGLSLAGTSGNALATIKAGLVTTTTSSTIGEFVIEWYRDVIDGTPEFVSGSAGATDPAVTVSHPFNGEPAEGGTWHPVIKYVYIDGIKYSRNYTAGVRHSPDLLHCLDPIIVIVNNLTCANGGSMIINGASYAHKVTYTNGTVSPTLASRSVRFDLDATNKYFAWRFDGYSVADQIQITYVSPVNGTSTVLEYWKIGSDAGGNNVTVSPKLLLNSLNKITPLTQFNFAAGDYLRINIIPSANSNTNWDFYCKCFSTVDCNIWDSNNRQIQPGSVSMIWNSQLCQYELRYNKTAWVNSTLTQYHNFNYFLGGGAMQGYEAYSSQVKLIFRKNTSYSATGIATYSSCGEQADSSTITKNGNVVTAVFKNASDYNYHKSSYQSTLAHSQITNYSSDNTVSNHYKFLVFHFAQANSCGDSRVDRYFYSHINNLPTFDDANLTITINLASISNNYVPVSDCNNATAPINGMISSINSGISTPNFSFTTKVRGATNPISGIYIASTTLDEIATTYTTPRIFTASPRTPSIDVCDLTTKGWNGTKGLVANQWAFDFVWDRVTITSTTEPENNFKLERLMDNNGVALPAGSYIKVYEIVNGVVQP